MAIENEDQVSVLEGGDGRGAAPKTPEVSALLRAPTTAADIAGKISGVTGIGRRAQAASREMPGVLQQATEAELEARRAEDAVKRAGLEQAARAEKVVLDRARGAMEAAEKEIKPYQEFVQPQYKASDYAANAAARLFTGLMLGGVAKMSAIGQLQAIRDMQKAEDQGLREEFNAARIKFEESEKARKDFNANIKERLDRVMKLLPYDRNAALAEAKIIESKLLDGAAVASVKRGDIGRIMKFLEADIEGGRKLEQALAQAKIRAESRQPAAGQIFIATNDKGEQVPVLIDRTGQATPVKMPPNVSGGITKPTSKPPEAEKPINLPSAIAKTLDNIGSTRVSMVRMSQSMKPQYFGIAPTDAIANAIVNGVERGLPVGELVGSVVKDAPKVTAETVGWWKDYNEYVSKVRNLLFGATLTGAERDAFRQFTISPATAPNVAVEYLNKQMQLVNNAVARERAKAISLRIPPKVIDAYIGLPEESQGPKSFANVEELDAAAKRGEVKAGDRVTVGGRTGTYQAEK